jgi:hypothetical protein
MDIGYRRPRELIPPDLQLVCDAAAILRLREFDLFRAAWQDWFGQPPDDKAVERVFVAYLFHQHVPHWLRHFARRVIQDSAGGMHPPAGLAGAEYPRHEPLADPGEGFVTALYIAAVVICVMLAA